MAFDQGLAERVRGHLSDREGVVEKKMFGGLAFMIDGNMCCGVMRDMLMVRVGPDAYDDVLARPHTRPMDFTGRPVKSMVYVDGEGLKTDEELSAWIERAAAFVGTLPAK
jgi:TfoX/Sxy family transcriptional regulator of competence genes